MKQHSLGRRAVAVVLITEVVCAIVFCLTSLWHERRVRQRALDVMLQGRSDSLLGAIQDAEDPADNVKIDPEELRLPSEDVWAVYNQGGKLIGESQNASPDLVSPGAVEIREMRVHGRRFRVIQRAGLRIIDRDDNSGLGLRRPVTIVYAVPSGRLFHEIREAAAFYIFLSLVLVCVTALVLILSFRRLLQPLQELAANAAEVGKHSESFTPPQSALQIRELRPLAQALSSTIERLRHALTVEHRFISDAAHELKTAVAVVRSSVQLLTLRERTSEEYVQGLERVLTDNQRVEQLVSRMLTLGRFEEQCPEQAPSNLADCVTSTIDALSSWITSRHVRVLSNCDPVNIAISSEAAKILVSNLVMNAVQHSPEGAEVYVSARCTCTSEVLLQVSDHGSGIPAASLPHVFERFFRDDRSRSRQTGGAGLGLAICKSIVEGAGGTIQIASESGHGTTVTASLRLVGLVPHASSSESTLQA